MKRALKNITSTVDDQVHEFELNLEELKSEFYGRVASNTNVTVARIMDKVSNLDEEYNLDDMSYVRGVRFDPDKVCLSGTREEVLEAITYWVHSDASRVLWLTGGAGTGKSAIAHTIAARFSFLQRLGSSFFFARGQAGHEPQGLFSTFARDLADLDPEFRQELASIVRKDRALRTTSNVLAQFENFLVKPSVRFTMPGPVIFVIDALDECGDTKSRRVLLDILSSRLKDLPPNFRFIVTSRDEADIHASLSKSASIETRRMGDIPRSCTERDIHAFLSQRLEGLDVDLSLLTAKSEFIFQWAYVAAEYIAEDQPGSSWEERYDTVLNSGSIGDEGPLDSLYREVLEQLFLPSANALALARFSTTMALVLSALTPLSVESLSVLLPHQPPSSPLRPDLPKPFDPMTIVKFMGSLLSGVSSRTTPIKMLHASFADFLLSSERSGRFFVDLRSADRDVALACLSLMKQQLRFNICGLATSYLPNDRVSDLPAMIERNIPASLSYASLYWASHLSDTPPEPLVYDAILEFLSDRLLFWLEVVSLLGAIRDLPAVITSLLAWAQDARPEKNDPVSAIATDLQLYLPKYGAVIARSTPHIYLSLPFLPERSDISTLYLPHLRSALRVASQRTSEWPLEHGVFSGHTEEVWSVAVSPNCARLASGSEDGTIRYWDVATGTLVVEPIIAHGGEPVNQVLFSPNGHLIASAGNDGTIRLFDTTTCEQVGEPLRGHTGVVICLSFSPDGRLLASGGYDEAVIIWDIAERKRIYAPIHPHTMAISCLAFSADGSFLVSGSYDGTVAFHLSVNGQPMRQPLQAYGNMPVSCIAMSPDGLQMATGAYDDKILLWDTTHWACVGSPSRSQNDFVCSAIAFSPDSKYLAFNSHHESFTICDAMTCCTVGGPMRGHDSHVCSIAFFRDGARIVSASSDHAVRLWNIPDPTSKPTLPASSVHSASVNAVAWSPDGERIVTGSHDETVRLWNVSTGKALGAPRKGHTKTIMCVAYSPDGRFLASGAYDNTIRIFSVEGPSSLSKVLRGHTGSVNGVAFDSTSKLLVSASDDGTVRIWEVASGRLVRRLFRGHKPLTSVRIALDVQIIASAGQDCVVRLWDLNTGEPVGEPLKGPESVIQALSFLNDGSLLVSGHADGSIVVWDVERRQMLGKPVPIHSLGLMAVAISPDGEHIVSSSWDRGVRMTAVDRLGGNHAPGPWLEGHDHAVFSLAFSPKGRTVATASYDRTVRLWDTTVVARKMPAFSLCDDSPLSPSASVPFSSRPEHALAHPDLFFPSSTDTSDRRDEVKLTEEGWVVGPNDTLLLWVPPELRVGLWTPRTIGILGEAPTMLDLSSFAHGTRWIDCWFASQ
ncbi:WD40 repeat-like protein [Peniophora sp. CONT]|nr:WD40 repeat-like protein [Peniophora sp. CONT]